MRVASHAVAETSRGRLVVGIYGRVSTTEQETSNQLVQLREFAAKHEWTVAAEYVDRGQSGAKAGSTRPEFARMMRDASQRRFDLLLFWSLDRLSREGVSQTLDYLNRLSGWGVGFRSFTEPYLDSLGVFKDAVLAILACIAKQERIRISERTKAGLERARRNGKRLGRIATKAAVVELIRQMRASGKTVRETAKVCGVSVGTVCKAFKGAPR
jgi:DNA invertase Pin-like site-specific DNA recombinase